MSGTWSLDVQSGAWTHGTGMHGAGTHGAWTHGGGSYGGHSLFLQRSHPAGAYGTWTHGTWTHGAGMPPAALHSSPAVAPPHPHQQPFPAAGKENAYHHPNVPVHPALATQYLTYGAGTHAVCNAQLATCNFQAKRKNFSDRDSSKKKQMTYPVYPRGISQTSNGKWMAQVYYSSKKRYIRVFDSKGEASRAYEIARGELGISTTDLTGKKSVGGERVLSGRPLVAVIPRGDQRQVVDPVSQTRAPSKPAAPEPSNEFCCIKRYQKYINDNAAQYWAATRKDRKRILDYMTKVWTGKLIINGNKLDEKKTRKKITKALHWNAKISNNPEYKDEKRQYDKEYYAKVVKEREQERRERKQAIEEKKMERFNLSYMIAARAKQEGKPPLDFDFAVEAQQERKAAAAPNGDTHGDTYEEDDDMIVQFVRYKEQFGHAVILSGQAPPGMMNWATDQRRRQRDGKMSKARFEKLDRLGFDWSAFYASS